MTYASIYSKNEPQNFKIEINFIKQAYMAYKSRLNIKLKFIE